MAETLVESKVWPLSLERSKLAVQKARRYFTGRDKHVLYEHCDWHLRTLPEIIAAKMPGCIVVRETARLLPAATGTGGSITPEYVRTVNELIELLELPGGWNSYNAKPIKKENVTFAVGLLAKLMRANTPAPQVVPKVRGGVQLEWHMRGIDIEIAIDSPEEASFFAEDHRSKQERVEEELDEQILGEWIHRISE